ncbi:hypothetical protein M422DRAFT_73394 [Sphaerobolus stellatus SS14]|nr:hypothetical protein M422DRAFT_73394 [Sphaerobolus stellatus SS14]
MFFYLSFLRQLPRTSKGTSPVSTAPQIANDLRTAYLEDTPDVFYIWVSSLSDCLSPSVGSAARKLTTWHTSSMYKALSLPLPPNAKPGQGWRLCLSCNKPRPSFYIDLAAENFGVHPFPVISMPVGLDPKGGQPKASDKQEQIERLFRMIVLTGPGKVDKIFCIREQTSFDLDKKIWDSGLGLSSWLTKLFSEKTAPSNYLITRIVDLCQKEGETNIIELGTGTGIVSICLATLLETAGKARRHILATDLPSAMELIDHNVEANKKLYPNIDLTAAVLDWDDQELPEPAHKEIDLIVMADVTYNTASFPALVQTIDRIMKTTQRLSEARRLPGILLAYKQRDPSERELWHMLEGIRVHLTLVDKVVGAGAEPVEIWICEHSKVSQN